MSRKITVAAAQVGAVHKDASKPETVQRLIKLLRDAADKKVQLLVSSTRPKASPVAHCLTELEPAKATS